MPYIDPKAREFILCAADVKTAGELNFYLTTVLKEYVETKGLSYQTINDISGAMTECLAEFRRRIVVPYEIQKCHDNGDVYE